MTRVLTPAELLKLVGYARAVRDARRTHGFNHILTLEAVGRLEGYLDFLDPEREAA